MKRDYFAKSEQIYKGGRAMIIMDIKVDNMKEDKNRSNICNTHSNYF